MRHHIDRNTIGGYTNVATMIIIKTTKKNLLSLPAASMLCNKLPRHFPQYILCPIYRSIFKSNLQNVLPEIFIMN